MSVGAPQFGWYLGVDEVGRGPLAGPVAVGVVCVPVDFAWSRLPGVTDSKRLTAAKREVIAAEAAALRRAGLLHYTVVSRSASLIDRDGIAPTIRAAVSCGLARMARGRVVREAALVQLDGGLRPPRSWPHYETIIGGDAIEPTIGLASIVAKVSRDAYMTRLAARPEFAPYDLAGHKGYGTKTHRAAIALHGLSTVHRASYCTNIKM